MVDAGYAQQQYVAGGPTPAPMGGYDQPVMMNPYDQQNMYQPSVGAPPGGFMALNTQGQ